MSVVIKIAKCCGSCKNSKPIKSDILIKCTKHNITIHYTNICQGLFGKTDWEKK